MATKRAYSGKEIRDREERLPAIIVSGDPLSGFRFIGPFESYDEAEKYLRAKYVQNVGYPDAWVYPLDEPEADLTWRGGQPLYSFQKAEA